MYMWKYIKTDEFRLPPMKNRLNKNSNFVQFDYLLDPSLFLNPLRLPVLMQQMTELHRCLEHFWSSHWNYSITFEHISKSLFNLMVLNVFRFNEFDHKFFGISDSEVEQMDPQQKQLLQCVYRALENAGIPMEEASGTRTGVFLGW